jgi:tRNA (cmo5U34)-methyltransferase
MIETSESGGAMADPSVAETAWTEEDSVRFIESGAAFTPERDRQHATICTLLAPAANPGGLIVELCCGAGALAKRVLDRFPRARLLALDGSAAMRKEMRNTCAAHEGRFEIRDFDLAARDWRAFDPRPDAVYSSLAIHHLADADKHTLFSDIFAALNPGGVIVISDLMRPTTAAGFQVAAETWRDEVASQSRAIFGDERALQTFDDLRWNYYLHREEEPGDMPSSVADHLAWLAAAGFAEADLHWMVAGHAILSARKP